MATLTAAVRLAVALLVLLAWPASAAAQVPTEPVIPPGAKAAGLDVGNLTLSQAAAKLDAAFRIPVSRPIDVRVAGRRRVLKPASIGFVFDPLKTARRANIAALATPPAPDGTHPVDVPLHTTYDRKKLAAFTVAVDKASRTRPRSARVRITLRRVKLRRARMGWSIHEKALAKALDPVLADPHAIRVVRLKRERVHPRVNANDLHRRYRTVLTIDRAHLKLRLFKAFKRRRTHPIAVGMPDYPTPTGRFTITNKAVNPAWSAPDRPWAGAYRNEVVAGGSPENPLKARWLGITGGVGIHGTDAEYSIGTRASHGCIRMRIPEVKNLYRRVPVGTAVLIR
jgi:lipoprotein-anchoring transpeptidase ErfK/SrfK